MDSVNFFKTILIPVTVFHPHRHNCCTVGIHDCQACSQHIMSVHGQSPEISGGTMSATFPVWILLGCQLWPLGSHLRLFASSYNLFTAELRGCKRHVYTVLKTNVMQQKASVLLNKSRDLEYWIVTCTARRKADRRIVTEKGTCCRR
jgi:hypothetical protein